MRGTIYPKLAAVLGLVTLTACAEGVDPGPNPESGQTGRPTTTESAATSDNNLPSVQQIVPSHVGGNDGPVAEVYRDLSAFVYFANDNQQVLQQWLIDVDGNSYWTRSCTIAPKGGGVQWNNCSSWDVAHAIADLGLPGFGPIAGMSTYVWTEQDADHARQYLAQSVWNERGDQRMGRICPILREPLWNQCTDWSKLESDTSDLAVPGGMSLRDDFYYSYKNTDGEDVMVQTMLSIDGSVMWDRSCVSAGASPLVPSYKCGFNDRSMLSAYNIRWAAVAGGAQYTYNDGDHQTLAQTLISVDGTKSYHRTCEVTPKGVDWTSCEPFTATTLGQVRYTQAPL